MRVFSILAIVLYLLSLWLIVCRSAFGVAVRFLKNKGVSVAASGVLSFPYSLRFAAWLPLLVFGRSGCYNNDAKILLISLSISLCLFCFHASVKIELAFLSITSGFFSSSSSLLISSSSEKLFNRSVKITLFFSPSFCLLFGVSLSGLSVLYIYVIYLVNAFDITFYISMLYF